MLNTIWQSAIDFAGSFYITPFWYWIFWAAVVTFVSGVIGWAFPALRSFAGAMILAACMGLAGYRRAQYDDAARQSELDARKQATPWRRW